MKKILFIFFCCISFLLSVGQIPKTVGELRYDTVKIWKSGGTAELRIINQTNGVKGYLYNSGNGITEFRRPYKINDSTLVFGIDTFRVGTGSGGSITATVPIKIITGNATLDYSANGFSVKSGKLFTKSPVLKSASEIRAIATSDLDTGFTYRSMINKRIRDYYYVPNDITTPDDSVINIRTSAGALLRMYTDGLIYVRDFGATVNDHTDDDAIAFNRAFRWIKKQGNNVYKVIFDEGQYKVKTTTYLPDSSSLLSKGHTWITIEGRSASILTDSSITIFDREPRTQSNATINDYFIPIYSFIIRGIDFYGDGTNVATKQKAIDIGAVYSPVIEDCNFHYFDTAIVLRFALNPTIKNNFFQGNRGVCIKGGTGVGIWSGATICNSGFNVALITKNRFNNYTGAFAAVMMENPIGCTVDDNISEGNHPQNHIWISGKASGCQTTNEIRKLWVESGGGSVTRSTVIYSEARNNLFISDLDINGTDFTVLDCTNDDVTLTHRYVFSRIRSSGIDTAFKANGFAGNTSFEFNTLPGDSYYDYIYTPLTWGGTIPYHVAVYGGTDAGNNLELKGSSIDMRLSTGQRGGIGAHGSLYLHSKLFADEDNTYQWGGFNGSFNKRPNVFFIGTYGAVVDNTGKYRFGDALNTADVALARDSIGQISITDNGSNYKNLKVARLIATTRSSYTSAFSLQSMDDNDLITKNQIVPYVDSSINAAIIAAGAADGSETKVTGAGVTGTGTIVSPYVISSNGAILTTIAALTANATPSTTFLYYTTDIGKQGFFRYNSTSTMAANASTEIIAADGKHFTKINNTGTISVKEFGAAGDGFSDDAPEILAAARFLDATGGGTLLFPAGSYMMAKTTFDSIDRVTFKGAAGAKIITLASPTTNFAPFNMTNCTYIKFISLDISGNYPVNRFNANATNSTHNIRILNCNDVEIYDCDLHDSGYPSAAAVDEQGDAVVVPSGTGGEVSKNIKIHGNRSWNPGRWHFAISGGENVYLEDNICWSDSTTGGCGIIGFFDCEPALTGRPPLRNFFVRKNTVNGTFSTSMGSVERLENVQFTNNHFNGRGPDGSLETGATTAYSYGLSIGRVDGLIVQGNEIKNNGSGSALVLDSCIGFTVSGNNIDGGDYCEQGIYIKASSDGTITNNVARVNTSISTGWAMALRLGVKSVNIIGNTLINKLGYAFSTNNTSDSIKFVNNYMIAASAKAVDISSPTNTFVSGNTANTTGRLQANSSMVIGINPMQFNTSLGNWWEQSGRVIMPDSARSRSFIFLSAAPTAGAWKVGDVVKNSAPTTSGNTEWVCTVAGTPGTWVARGTDKFPTITGTNSVGPLAASSTTFATEAVVKTAIDAISITGGNKLNALSILDYSGVANWVSAGSPGTDNTTPFNNMVAAAGNGQLMIMGYGEWYFASDITLSSEVIKYNLLILGNIHFAAGKGFIIKGMLHRFVCLGTIWGTGTGSTWSTFTGNGLTIADSYNSYFEVNEIRQFKNAIWVGGTHATLAKGSQYNTIKGKHLRFNETQLMLSNAAGVDGHWTNTNYFYDFQLGSGLSPGSGGTTGIKTVYGPNQTDPFNNNSFTNIGCEGLTTGIDLAHAQYNTFFNIRFEQNALTNLIIISGADGSKGNTFFASHINSDKLNNFGNDNTFYGDITMPDNYYTVATSAVGNGNGRIKIIAPVWNAAIAADLALSKNSHVDAFFSTGTSVIKSANYTLEQGVQTVYCQAASGNINITLPSPSSNAQFRNREVTVKLINASSTATIIGAADGAAFNSLTTNGYSLHYKSNSSAWWLESNVSISTSDVSFYTATDANYTVPAGAINIVLPTITATRTLTLPTATQGKRITIWSKNSTGFTWNYLSGVLNPDETSIANAPNDSVIELMADGTNWVKTN